MIYLVKQHVYPTTAMPSAIGQYSPVSFNYGVILLAACFILSDI